MNPWPPTQREVALKRIEAIDAQMVEIRRRTAISGENLRTAWNDLFAERSASLLVIPGF